MRIYADKLASRLADASAIWLSGDEPLQMRDCADMVRRHYREQGFTEREVYDVDQYFNWQTLHEASNTLSLFAEKKLIELRLRSSKLDDKSRKSLIQFLQDLPPDSCLLISSPRIEAASTKTQWFQQIDKHCLIVQIYPIDTNRLSAWIRQRLQQRQLQAEPDAIQTLIERIEGNLLAADQEIEKLALLFGPGAQISANRIAKTVADNARFTVFGLIDTCLAAQPGKALRSLHRLRDEGSEPLMVNAMLLREIRLLGELRYATDQGQDLSTLLGQHRVWKNRQPLVSGAVRRLGAASIQDMTSLCRQVDLAVKGLGVRPPWLLLEELILQLSGAKSPYAPAQQSAHA